MSRDARPETTAAKRSRERADRRSTGVQAYDRSGPRVTRLPVVPEQPPVTHMLAERGERRLCAHEAACLDGHIAAHRHADTPASCPTPCRWWAAPESRVADHLYRVGAGALAHADQHRERWADDPRERRGGR